MIAIESCTVTELVAESQTLLARMEVTSDLDEVARIGADISAIRRELEVRSLLRDGMQRQLRKRNL